MQSPIKGKVAYTNGFRNIYLNDGDSVPDGFVKGGMAKGKTNHKCKVDWHDPTIKSKLISLLIECDGNLTKVADYFSIKITPLKKQINRHYPDINILDYVPKRQRFYRDKDYALSLCNKFYYNVRLIAIELDIDIQLVKNALIRFDIGNFDNDDNQSLSDLKYKNKDKIDVGILYDYLSKYATTDYKDILINRYIKHIGICNTRNRINLPDIIEKHHILPKSLFPQFQNFIHYKWNMALLTPREHFIAHLYLHYLIGKGMTSAINAMIVSDRYDLTKNNRLYQKLREEYKSMNALKKWGIKTSQKMIGSVYYNNGKIHKKIKKGERIPDGWVKGCLARGQIVKKAIEDTQDNINTVLSMLSEHEGNLYKIAEYYGVSYPSVDAFCKRNDINWRLYQPTNIRYRYVRDYAEEVYTRHNGDWKLMAKEIGVQASTIRNQYKKVWDID